MRLKPDIFARFRTTVFAVVVGVLVGLPALAQSVDVGLDAAASTGLSTVDIRTFVGRVVNYFLSLLGIIAVALIMYAGFLWMTANGNEEKIAQAKRIILNAVIGLVIIMSAFAIVQFVLRAIVNGSGGAGGAGGSGGCPPGQTCFLGSGGSSSAFRVTGIVPSGPGLGDRGWPKNYAVTVNLSANVLPTSVTAGSFEVRRCNPRVSGDAPQAFEPSSCGDAIVGTRTVTDNKISFKPSGTPGDQPTDFESDRWYTVRVRGGDIRDSEGRTLYCPFPPSGLTGDIASTTAQSDLCDRAIAFNDQRDATAPTVELASPVSPPAFCGTARVPVRATATDDFLSASIDYLLDGGTAGLVDGAGEPAASEVNVGLTPVFSSSAVHVDFGSLSAGSHTVTAVAQDGVPQMSSVVSRSFTVNPAHCCNAVRDESEGETAVDCGGACGSCTGGTCTSDAQCASGFCDAATGRCAERPIIDDVTPLTAGNGSHVTIKGRFFGFTAGSITFLGGPESTDDVQVSACSTDAWSDGQIVVVIPAQARTGPISISTASGHSDTTADDRGPNLGALNVTGPVLPGICTVSPAVVGPGAEFAVNGAGFGGSIGSSRLSMGSFAPSISTSGWTESRLTAVVPAAPEATYPVRVNVAGADSNPVDVRVSLSAGGVSQPRVVSVIPESAPPGSYVTIIGTGFGSLQGTVRFKFGEDTAVGEETVCSDSWHDDYVVVQVPRRYDDGSEVQVGGGDGVVHKIQVTTASPFRASNDDVTFGITNGTPLPGICAVDPDNGPPGKTIEVRGTGFGSTSAAGAASLPRYSVDFYDGGAATLVAPAYSFWQPSSIGTVVPGVLADRTTWPETGPVSVTANGVESGNAVPFIVGDCHASGASCGVGTTCCANGSCQERCEPVARDSAYGWIFSTDVLPAFPVVVEHAQCDASADPNVLQSPSPYKGSTDACINSEIRVEFSRLMDMGQAVLAQAVEFRDCGSGDAADCSAPALSGLRFDPRDCDGSSTDCKVLTFVPSSEYNDGLPMFKQRTWYQVRLISDPAGGRGMREGGDTEGRWLDGDTDRRAGGDYVYTFRTRNGEEPCELDSVFVDPPKTTITQDVEPVDFQAVPTANCNSLRCSPTQPYTLEWFAEAMFLELRPAPSVPPAADSAECTRPILARAETASTPVSATMTPTGSSLTRIGNSDVTVKFAEPRVTAVTPADMCTAACINAAIVATFNVPMDMNSLERQGNVELLKCRNSSCTAPFLSLGSVVRRGVATPAESGVGGDVFRHVTLSGTGNLEPATYYLVRIRGGAQGVTSRSGVPLGGLNDGDTYVWTFRTKDDPNVCLASSTTLSPAEATLYYVGQRQGLTAQAFGSPDACDAGGQELVASSFAWQWSLPSPNPVIGGFVDGWEITPVSAVPLATLADTNAFPRQSCTSRCTLRGSQNVLPQCGNGRVEEAYEECDPSGQYCSNRCLLTGTPAPTCGNGTLEAGENCESVGTIFPSGCKQPGVHVDGFADTLGCVLTGASTGRNVRCGDGLIGDGESCDDSNRSNGDGCSSDCLKEGSLPSCAPNGIVRVDGAQCINYCGNRITEPGEDPRCEPNPSAAGCDPSNCLMADPALRAAGSSALYDEPSYCGDGNVGEGEDASCEQSPDGLIDSAQTIETEPQASFNAALANSSTVMASTEGVSDSAAGTSEINLSCTCNALPAGERDSFCSEFAPEDMELGCATSGCCAPRPRVTDVMPDEGRTDVCRNAAIEVSFDQVMDPASVKGSIVVGYRAGETACPEGSTRFSIIPVAVDTEAEPQGFFARVFGAIADFVRGLFIRPAMAQFGFGFNFNFAAFFASYFNYCSVPVNITVTDEGTPQPSATVAHVALQNALPADSDVVVRVLPGVRSASGVAMQTADRPGYRVNFTTGGDICTISSVRVTPGSTLFSSIAQPPATLTARAIASNRQEIVPTVEYDWTWQWTPQPATAPSISPIVIEPQVVTEGTELLVSAFAYVRVRGSATTDAPIGYRPTNGQAVAEAAAVIVGGKSVKGDANVTVFLCENPWPARRMCGTDGADDEYSLPWDLNPVDDSCTPDTAIWYPFYDAQTNYSFYYCRDPQKEGDVAELLPAFRETPVIVTPGRDIIKEYLFTYDTGVYSPKVGDDWQDDAVGFRLGTNPDHRSASQWYALKGFKGSPTPTTVDGFEAVQDGRTTYVNAAQNVGGLAGGNLYTNIGVFSYTEGAAPETVNIYDQILDNVAFLTEGGFSLPEAGICVVAAGDEAARCVTNADCRVDAAGKADPARSAYTCDAERAVCRDSAGRDDLAAGVAVACSHDLDCQKDATGKFMTDIDGNPIREDFRCDAVKQKLVRDTKRWSDLQTMRANLGGAAVQGKLPRLEAGSYLTTVSTSAWPSWTSTLAAGAGISLPNDPINLHGRCEDEDRNGETCWNDKTRTYVCPSGSHVYAYGYRQEQTGADFTLKVDFETQAAGMNAVWRGNTCIERTVNPEPASTYAARLQAACVTADGLCAVGNGACNYVNGKLQVGGVNRGSVCSDALNGGGSSCGDGVVNPGAGEICEPGQESSAACGTGGLIAQVCVTTGANACRAWTDKAGATCRTGRCGDGVVNGDETCDDGDGLNGTYGHCAAGCRDEGLRCGDGAKQPGEACDCGSRNGLYYFNGRLQPSGDSCPASDNGNANRNSCAWDCSGAGPRCGDGVVNGPDEICDGGYQEAPGYCTTSVTSNSGSKAPCTTDADCNGTGSGGSDEKCGHYCPTPEQRNRRLCGTNAANNDDDDGDACTWARWNCTAAGFCGNGIKETGEQCDDGNTVNTDGCVIDPIKNVMCKTAVCGDGFVYAAGGEQCDDGRRNGAACSPEYGLACTYCTSQCKAVSISGGFCGDNKLQEPSDGPEQCDGSLGLSGDYVCVSTRPEHQSYGLRTGTSSQGAGAEATCADNSCLRVCQQPDSVVCRQRGCSASSGSDDNFDGDDNNYWLERGYEDFGIDRPLCDVCDPDWDNDGVPNDSPADCRKRDARSHGAYTLQYQDLSNQTRTLSVVPARELCDSIDNNCNGIVDDTPPVDMVFLIDGSGSMDTKIDKVANAIATFAGNWNCSEHRFAIVVAGMPVGTHESLNHSFVYMNFSKAQWLDERMHDLADEVKNGLAWASFETTIDAVRDVTGTNNPYGLDWRTDVKRKIVVVVTDTWGQSIHCGDGSPDYDSSCAGNPAGSASNSLHGFLLSLRDAQDGGDDRACIIGFGCKELNVWAYTNVEGSDGAVGRQWDYLMAGSTFVRDVAMSETDMATDLKNTVFAGVCAPPILPGVVCPAGDEPEILEPPEAVINSFLPTNGLVGASVAISGQLLGGYTIWSFNGTPASGTLNASNDKAFAYVPPGATTGRITISTSSGESLTTSSDFVVDQPPLPMCGDTTCHADLGEFCPTRSQFLAGSCGFGNPNCTPTPGMCGQECCLNGIGIDYLCDSSDGTDCVTPEYCGNGLCDSLKTPGDTQCETASGVLYRAGCQLCDADCGGTHVTYTTF